MISLSGVAAVVDGNCDPTPFLRERKTKKYLGLQDALAVVSAGRALAAAGFGNAPPRERTGLFVAVGYIPFQLQDVEPVLAGSLDDRGSLSLARFAADGYTRAHPLLAFRCLPNMPAYHVAANFGIEGPYSVLYPSAGQLYLALEEASHALATGDIDVALVTGIAHQRNFLVEHHMSRIEPPVAPATLRDAGATLVLERADSARSRGKAPLAELAELETRYVPFDPLADATPREESVETEGGAFDGPSSLECGPASLGASLTSALEGGATRVVHRLRSRDGIRGTSTWRRSHSAGGRS